MRLTQTLCSITLAVLAASAFAQNVLTIPQGDKYAGQITNGKPNGLGVYTYGNGETFSGCFVEGKLEGLGSYESARGSQYVGEFVRGKRHGQGTYTSEKGEAKNGTWESGRFVSSNTIVTSAANLIRWSGQDSSSCKVVQRGMDTVKDAQLNEELSKDFETERLSVTDYLLPIQSLIDSGDQRAVQWLIGAAKQGSVEAQYHLGLRLIQGKGITQNTDEGEHWLIKSASAGNFESKRLLETSFGWTDEEINIRTVIMPKCTSFGFKESTDSHATCVMELKIADEALSQARIHHEELSKLIVDTGAAGLARSEAANQYQRQQQRERDAISRQQSLSQTLLGIGAGLLNSGQPMNTGNLFKTCYYNVAGETVPFSVSIAGICPPSRDFNGISGFLQ